jgi:hypothetical protein
VGSPSQSTLLLWVVRSPFVLQTVLQKTSRRSHAFGSGDRRQRFCVVGRNGEVVEEGSLVNERAQLSALVGRYPAALVVMEAGCHSAWVSRYLSSWDVK